MSMRADAKARTRAKVLAVAASQFATRGYERTTIRTIAKEMRMSTGAIFANFKGKEELYQEISPEVCLWPTPDWLWDNVQDGVAGAGSYKTPIVRGWMVTLGVKKNLCVKDGDQILR